jgi:hypothetical protein
MAAPISLLFAPGSSARIRGGLWTARVAETEERPPCIWGTRIRLAR